MAHFLLLTSASQGHINPTLQFADRLIRKGARVTFATGAFAHRRMLKPPSSDGLTYASFEDGSEQGLHPTENPDAYMVQVRKLGPQSVSDLIRRLAEEGSPVTCVVYTIVLEWVADVARAMRIPSVFLFIQPSTVLTVYYYHFHGFLVLKNTSNKDHSSSIELPGLPPLEVQELPSFILPPDNYPVILSSFEEQFRILDKETKPRVLVNTFDELEGSVIKAIDKLDMVTVGPLIPSAFLGPTQNPDTVFGGGDLFEKSRDYSPWLDSKPESSVVYVSFGSIFALPEHQMAEILNGLLESGRPFLWIIRAAENRTEMDTENEFWKRVKAAEERKVGLVVPWCSQVEVLSHPSVGSFVSHCGWNSTSESLAMGIPMVAFPQWTDQPTNAKLVESVWKTGVRAKVNGNGVLEGWELKRCLAFVMGESGEEMRKNAQKWNKLARKASAKGGSSDRNIEAFVDEMTTTLNYQSASYSAPKVV